jgi:hypothetical protein
MATVRSRPWRDLILASGCRGHFPPNDRSVIIRGSLDESSWPIFATAQEVDGRCRQELAEIGEDQRACGHDRLAPSPMRRLGPPRTGFRASILEPGAAACYSAAIVLMVIQTNIRMAEAVKLVANVRPQMAQFLVGVRQLLVQTCSECAAMSFPEHATSSTCLSSGAAWTPVNGRDEILSFEILLQGHAPGLSPEPCCRGTLSRGND